MSRDTFIRGVLWMSALFNFGGAVFLAFPSSVFGQLIDLPSAVPLLYRAFVAFFVLLFGGAYGWLACQKIIDRPIVALAAVGKTGIFLISFVLWLLNEATSRGLMPAIGDLIFAIIFTWWLFASREAGIRTASPRV